MVGRPAALLVAEGSPLSAVAGGIPCPGLPDWLPAATGTAEDEGAAGTADANPLAAAGDWLEDAEEGRWLGIADPDEDCFAEAGDGVADGD